MEKKEFNVFNRLIYPIIPVAIYLTLTNMLAFFAGLIAGIILGKNLNIYALSVYIMQIANFLLMPIFYILYKRDLKRPNYAIMWRERLIEGKRYALIPCIIFLCWFFGTSLINIIGTAENDKSFQSVNESFNSVSVTVLLYSTVIVAPIAEELMCRLLMYGRLRLEWGIVVSAITSSLVFGFLHGNVTQGIYAFALGIVLSLSFEYYKKIWVTIVMHMALNFLSLILPNIPIIDFLISNSIAVYITCAVSAVLLIFILGYLFKTDDKAYFKG